MNDRPSLPHGTGTWRPEGRPTLGGTGIPSAKNTESFLTRMLDRAGLLANKPQPTQPTTSYGLRRSTTTLKNRFAEAVRRVAHSADYIGPERSSNSMPSLGSEQSPNQFRAPLGVFAGRPIIGEQTTIQGGVYLGAQTQEALVIDDRYGQLDRAYAEILALLADGPEKPEEFQIMRLLTEYCTSQIRFNSRATEDLMAQENLGEDRKAALDIFIHAHTGVARHQVLLAAYLVERLRRSEVLTGHLSLDPISAHPYGWDERLYYTMADGNLFVFDPLFIAATHG